jgi:O-antigen ligase
MDNQVSLPRPVVIAIAAISVIAFAITLLIPVAFPGEDAWLMLPLGIVALVWLMPLLLALLRGEPWAFVLALAMLIFLTDASFRARHWTDKSLDWQVLLKGAAWAGCGMVGLIRLSRTGPMLSTPPAMFTGLFVTMLLATAMWSPMPLYTVLSATAFFWILLFGLAAAEVLDEHHLLAAIALGCGLIVLPSLAISPFAMGLTPPSPGSTGEVDRLRGLTDHPIPLAETAALFTFAVGALALRARGVAPRLGFLLLVAAGIATVALTQSRLAPIAMLAAIFGFLAYRKGGWLLMVPTVTLFAVLVLTLESIGGFANMLPRELLELVSRSGSSHEILSLSGRTDIWPYVLDRITESPLIGHGHASGMMLFKSFTRWRITHAHNLYLQALLYAGGIGFALLIAALLAPLKIFLRDPKPVRDILLLYTLLKGITEQSILSNMPSGSVAIWMVTVGMAALAWRPARRTYVALGTARPSAP